MALVFSWKEAYHPNGDPQLIGMTLEAVAVRRDLPYKALTPELVLKEAVAPDSVLHPLFQWDDARAAHAHRLQQARQVLNSLRRKVILDGQEHEIIHYASIEVDGAPLYIRTDYAAQDQILREQMIASAASGLQAWRGRYDNLRGIEHVLQLIDQAIEQLSFATEQTIATA